MEKRRILAIIMAALMVITLLPSMVFASAPAGSLGGKLRIKGHAAVGTTLGAEYGKAEPQGLSDDYVSFKWFRELSETELVEIGTEKTYKVTEEDLGYKLVLEVTGREDLGVTGTLKAKTLETAATAEEAKALADQKAAEGQEIDTVDETEEAPESEDVLEDSQIEEVPQDDAEMTYDETQDETVYDENVPEDTESDDAEFDITESDEWNSEEIYEETPIEGEIEGELDGESADEIQEEPVYSAEAVAEDGSDTVNFGTVETGKEADAARFVTIKNTGNRALNFIEISPEHFMVQDITEALQPGTEIQVWIQPREGLEAGEYNDVITYSTEEMVEVSFQAQMTLTAPETSEEPENPEEPETPEEPENPETPEEPENPETPEEPEAPVYYEISTDLDAMIFGNLTEGYEQVTEMQTVTVTNSGESTATLKMPQSEFFDVLPMTEDDFVLEKGETFTVFVQPKLELAANVYSEELIFGIEESEETVKVVTAEVIVDAAAVEEVISVTADPAEVLFDSLTEGYEGVEPVTVTLTNEGNTDIILEQPLAENFNIGGLSATELAVGESVTFTVVPVQGLPTGVYEEAIEIFRAEAGENEILATIAASVSVEKEEPVYQLEVAPDVLDFGECEVGYEQAPESQKVTVVNKGNTTVTLEKPVSEYFRIGNLSDEVLEPGEKCVFNIRPKNGLEESSYMETIVIPNDGNTEAQVEAAFVVTVKTIELIEIQKPADITGLKNGVDKTAEALGLPSTVVIKTTNGKMKAKINWNVNEASYNPSSKEAQTFNVKGKVTLPGEVENPNGISLVTSVTVSVNAGYVPKVPDASENKITGISSEGYTTQSKITFTAVGAGMDNTSPRKGDVRYVPLKWKVINTNSWQDAPYTATFGITKAGTYTLKVMFDRQQFNGSEWVGTGEQDTKQVNFSIAQAENVTPTPKAQEKDKDKKTAVATGDTTAIMPFVLILIVAVFCIAGVIIYRKKRK